MRDPDDKYGKPRCPIGEVVHEILRTKRWGRSELARQIGEKPFFVTKLCSGQFMPLEATIRSWKQIREFHGQLFAARMAQRKAAFAEAEERRNAAPPLSAATDSGGLVAIAMAIEADPTITSAQKARLTLLLGAARRAPGMIPALEVAASALADVQSG